MYVPAAFAEERLEVLHPFMAGHGFATLVSGAGGALEASHVPVMLDASHGPLGTLALHLARQNGHWESIAAGAEVLAIFSGPHAYVSPRWYANPVSVPTWNYVVAHAYGRARVMADDALREHLHATVTKYEGDGGWSAASLPGEVFEKLQRQVIGFEIEITRLQGKWKLGQNRTNADRQGAIAGLRAAGGAEPNLIADLMAAALRGGDVAGVS
jgi:transcriptional regulator